MHRNKLLMCALLLVVGRVSLLSAQQQAGSPQSAAGREVVAAEKAIWESIKAQRWADFDKSIAGMTYIDPGAMVVWKPGNPKQFEGMVMRSYSLDSVTTRAIASDIVLLTYKATLDQTVNGKQLPSPVYMMSLWQRKSGKWTPIAHSETPVANAQGG